MKMNKHYNELKASYLFVDIAHKVAAYQEAHPEKEIIRLGIGDVTQPLAKCVVQAMRDAAEEMGMAFLKGRTLADEIEALATLTVDDVNKALQTMLLEENSAYIQIDPKE